MNHADIMRRGGYVPAHEVATATGRALSTIHRWAASGKIKGTRSDRRLYIEVESLRALFKGNEPMLQRLRSLC